MKKLAIITTHPIQYYAPVFRLLSQSNLQVKVFYTWGESSVGKFDPGFGRKIEWDIPLLEGYDYQYLKNTSSNPGSSHFRGIINPDAVEQINAFGPNAILVFGWSYHSHLKIIRHFKGKVPVWFRGDSTLLDPQPAGVKRMLKTLFLRWVYKHIDKAFYVGTANKEYFLKYGLKERQLIFAPHAIDNTRFQTKMVEQARDFRKQLGIGDNDVVLLFAGKFEKKKNPDLLLKAFAAVQKPDVHLVLVGNGIIEENLKKEAVAISNVHFMPFQNQSIMPVIYQAADLFCYPSGGPGETWGLAVNEAMACSKAIIASDKVGCAVDLIKGGYNGFIVIANNISDLIEKLQFCLSSPTAVRLMGEKSASIIKDWNFNKLIAAIVNEFSSHEPNSA